jgi:hypothetical protein
MEFHITVIILQKKSRNYHKPYSMSPKPQQLTKREEIQPQLLIPTDYSLIFYPKADCSLKRKGGHWGRLSS